MGSRDRFFFCLDSFSLLCCKVVFFLFFFVRVNVLFRVSNVSKSIERGRENKKKDNNVLCERQSATTYECTGSIGMSHSRSVQQDFGFS